MSNTNEIIEKYKMKLSALADKRMFIINKFIKKLIRQTKRPIKGGAIVPLGRLFSTSETLITPIA